MHYSRHWFYGLIILCSGLLASCSLMNSESDEIAQLSGRIMGSSPCGRLPPPDSPARKNCEPQPLVATLTATALDRSWSSSVASDMQGYYRLPLAQGQYRLEVESVGIYSAAQREITVLAGQELRQDWRLRSQVR